MCVLCDQAANGHSRWFLNPAAYSRKLYKVRKSADQSRGADVVPRTMGRDVMGRPYLDAVARGDVATAQRIKTETEERMSNHVSQVVTLGEALHVLDIVYPICLNPCACRRVMRGVPNEENYVCFHFSPAMYKWEMWPDSHVGEVQFVTPDEAKDIVTRLYKRGLWLLLSTVGITGQWAAGKFGQPKVAGICANDYPDCVMARLSMDYDLKLLWKSHWVAQLDPRQCNGCGKCVIKCQFRSLNYMPAASKVFIDMFRCFGCGLCADACPKSAISMEERARIPTLANNWY